MFNMNIKLNIFYKSDSVLIILKNNNNLKIQIFEIKKLIKKIF